MSPTLILTSVASMVLLPYSFCVGDITRSMGNVVSYMYYFSHMYFFFWSMSFVLHCILVYLYTINDLILLFLCVFQLLCLMSSNYFVWLIKALWPRQWKPSLPWHSWVFQDKSFGSVLRWIVPSHSLVSFCSPFPCPIVSVRVPPSLGLFIWSGLQLCFVLNYHCYLIMLKLSFF